MTERLENYLLDQIERLTAAADKAKADSDFWIGVANGKSEEIKLLKQELATLCLDSAKKDEVISKWENMYKVQAEVLDKTEGELLEAQSK